MQVTVEKATGLERKLTVQVPGERLQQKIDARLREIGKQVKIRGFRPGRIPFKVLQQRYGQSVQQEIVAQEVQSSLVEAIEEHQLRPATHPVLEGSPDMKPGGDLHFTARMEVFPEISTIDTHAIRMDRPEAQVTDQDVEDMLETLRLQRRTWSDTGTAPQEGNQVSVEYVAHSGEGRVPVEGKQRLSIIMGQSGFEKLEKALRRLEPGAEAKTRLTFPEDYSDPALAGKSAKVELTLLNVQEARLPDIDEEFIRSFAVQSGRVEDLKKEVRGNLERELKQASNSFLKRQLAERLLEQHADLEVPGGFVREEAASLYGQATGQQRANTAEPDLEPFMEVARSRVQSGLLLSEIARQNHIMLDGARVRQAIETVANTYEQPQEVIRLYYSDQRLLKSIENTVLEEQVVDWVMDHAKVASRPMSFSEVINAATNTGQSK